ncbi:N-acetyllactosaminide beta-1,6-N-acetylglucosaminyl-transferase-like [Gigantopelta aegis]|uniref:N-acetyllactosaminide beta-1,6-N-acetylglucosaminyl-transferase-like n=1 Tax=Gigantopelta aegis TaxID=1735272 RepID=UPI001B88D1CC|nr:N-acetyllactosaminide beta-1,6-N-acetylglucosaminyl-transferase-like [Gigantopelta aegis]
MALSSIVVVILHMGYNPWHSKRLGRTSLTEEFTYGKELYGWSDLPRRNLSTGTVKETEENEPEFRSQRNREDFVHLNTICPDLLSGNTMAVEIAKTITRSEIVNQKSYDFDFLTFDCEDFRTRQDYIMTSSREELDFPLAFSIVVYKDVVQFERLLRAIYRPHNYYCIHVDVKAAASTHRAVGLISECLEHVLVVQRPVAVTWGKFSVLEADLLCMRELLRHGPWRYFINLTGQEYPLKTNREIVNILNIFKGANNVDVSAKHRYWFLLRWKRAWPPPHGIRPFKGNVHVFVNRDFVEYAIHSRVAKDFTEWLKRTGIPDETFFSSLNHNPHLNIPGSYTGLADTDKRRKPYIARFKNWRFGPSSWPCHGRRVRYICIFGVSDLPLLTSRPELFANKFHWRYQPLALDCLDWWHRNKILAENSGRSDFNDTYYRTIPYINSDAIVPLYNA